MILVAIIELQTKAEGELVWESVFTLSEALCATITLHIDSTFSIQPSRIQHLTVLNLRY